MRERLTTAGVRFGGSRVRRLVVPVGGLGLVALVIGVLVGAELPAASQGASRPAKATGAATVQRRDLVATDTESGTLGYTNAQTVYNRLTGTITWLPSAGQVIKAGQTLYKVDNGPVVLLDGITPAYRTLSSGVSDGPDVRELNQNLIDLGFDPSRQITVDQTWQAATTAAVDRWQAALGETQTGTVTLGQIVFLPGAQLIRTVQTVLGSTGGAAGASGAAGSSTSGSGSSSSGGATGASAVPVSPAPQFVSLTTTTLTTRAHATTTSAASPPAAPSPTAPPPSSSPGKRPSGSAKGHPGGSMSQLQALVALLRAEIAELKASRTASSGASPTGSRAGAAGAASSGRSSGTGGASSASSALGGSSGGSSGSGSSGASTGSGSSPTASAQAILQTSSTQEVVTVQLDATKQAEAVVGAPVTVQLPDGSTTDGNITQVSRVAQSSSSSSSGSGSSAGGSSSTPSATIPVTISVTRRTHLSGLDQAAVSVNFAQQRARNVLSVPVTSLIAVQGGGYTVQEATTPHSLIPVSVGLFAAGYVQISGSGLYPGLQVTDSQG